MFIHDRLGRRKDATGAIVDLIRVASSSGMGSTHLIGHELGHNLMSIARDAGVITDAQQQEINALFTDKNGKFDEEAFAEAFARELKRAFHETVQKRMEDVPPTKAGRALRRVADFIVTLARSFAFWRQERGLDPVTGQPLQAGQVLDAFLKRERTAVDEATQVANAARAAEARATQGAMANAPTQTVVDEDGTEVAYHERGGRRSAELDSVQKHDGIGEDVLDALDVMLRTEGDTTIYTREFGDVLLPFGRFLNQVPGLKGKGFLHVLEERTRKDGLSVLEAIEVILKSVEAAVRGKENKALRQGVRHAIDLNGYRAIVADNGDFREFITGYKIFTNEEKEKRSGVETDAIRRSEDYNPTFYDRLRQEGAERLKERIAQLLAERQVPKSVEELEQELEDLDIAHYRLLNARKKAEENGASQEELDALQKDIDENRAKSNQVAKAKKKLNQQRAKERKLYGDPNEQRSNHISGLFTSGPVAYTKPSLLHVGSNSGRQYFGWGLYSASWREGALVYMPREGGALMEQTWWTHRPAGDESHLLVDGEPLSAENQERVAATLSHLMVEYGVTMREMDEKMWRGWDDANQTGDMAYRTVEWFFRLFTDVGNPAAAASRALYMHDIDGVKVPLGKDEDGTELANYVAFSDEHLRVDHVYEYNPETDDFELKWHESEGGASLRFTETPLGQELVAKAFDAIVGSRVDLLLRPSRYYGNPYETRDRNPRNALVTEHLHRDVDVSEPKGFATEVSAEISRFGTREGDPTLREIRERCGSKARFYEVLGAVYETAEAVRSGLAEVVTGRERAMMENAGLQAADFIKHNATARATALGRKLYLMGREFAWKLYKEDIAAARAEAQAKVQEANAKTRAAKAQTRNAERREETARNQAYQNRWRLAEERFMREYERALLRHQAARKVSDVREKMQEQVDLLRLREAKKRALERERGVTFTALRATLGVDIPARLRALAGTQEDPFEAAAKLIAEIDDGFDKWVKRDRRDLLDGEEPYTYLNEQGERAYAETMVNVLKAVARDLSYGKLREALVNSADKIARAKPETVRVIVEGKLGRVARVLRLAQNADIVTLARRRIKSALAEANKRLSSANSGMRTRYMTAMRKQAKELIKTMQLAVSAQDNTKASEKKRYAMLAERARLAEELKVIESGKTPDDLAKDETLTDRQHQDAVKLMFLEKFGDLSYTIDPAEVWAKAAEAEAFVVS